MPFFAFENVNTRHYEAFSIDIRRPPLVCDCTSHRSCCAASSKRSNKFLPARVVRGQQLFHPLLLPRRIYRRCCLLRPRSRVLLRWRGLITFVLVSMAAYLWYMTVLAMLLRRGGGGGAYQRGDVGLNYVCSRVYGCVLVVHDCTSDAAA